MARKYRKIDPRVWSDERFVKLSDSEKLLTFYVLTSNQCNRIGLFRFSIPLAADELGSTVKGISDRFDRVCDTLKWKWDSVAKVLYIPTWWKYNEPSNTKHLMGCVTDLHEVPTTPLMEEFATNVRFMPDNLRDTLSDTLSKLYPMGMAYQEQELKLKQKLELKQDSAEAVSAPEPMPEVPNSIQAAWTQWLAYKAERREAYKPTGLRAAITHLTGRVSQIGPGAVRDKINKAMASGWKGWDFEDKANGHRQQLESINGIGDA